jgi:hypothetical protein
MNDKLSWSINVLRITNSYQTEPQDLLTVQQPWSRVPSHDSTGEVDMKVWLQRIFGRPAPKDTAPVTCPLELDTDLEHHKERLILLEKRLVILEDELEISRKGNKHVD